MPSTSASAGLRSAFEAWCAHQRQAGRLRRGSSEAVYRAMWLALADWCDAHVPPLRLVDLRAEVVSAYLAGRTGLLLADGLLTPRYQARMLSLVQRVQAHSAWRRQASGPAAAMSQALLPPARPRVGMAQAGDPPLHLSPADDQQLQNLLCQGSGPATAHAARWQTCRDRCAVALQLGAGLGPGDLRALRLGDVIVDGGPVDRQPWQLRVPASGSAPAHVAALAPWAGALLGRWLALRRAQALGGDWLFPATRSGKPWGKVAQYEAARRVLVDAGLYAEGGGSFRLRHTFAVRQLRHGHDETLVARWLGVVDPEVMARYRRVLASDAVAAPPCAPPLAAAQAAVAAWVLPV